jgi:uncharacterized protein (TIGR04255 family)
MVVSRCAARREIWGCVVPFEPAHGDHAIVEVAFQLELDRAIDPTDVQNLLQLFSRLRDDLPAVRHFTQAQASLPTSPSGPPVPLGGSTVGLEFASFRRDGSFEWRLLCADRSLTVNCTVYTRWARVWSKARDHLEKALEALSGSKAVRLRAVVLEYVDEFLWRGTDRVPAFDELVDFGSELLPKNLTRARDLWHLHQGWFATPEELLGRVSELPAGRVLERLNLDSLARPALGYASEHVVRIHHLMRYEFFQIPSTDLSENGSASRSFEALHNLNKRRLSELLTRQAQQRIGLDGAHLGD